MAAISIQLIIACWVGFLGYWGFSALGEKPVAERQPWLSIFVHRVPILLGGALLWYPRLPYPLDLPLTPHTDLPCAFGGITCALGLVVAIWSRRTLAGNWSSTVTFKQGHELIQTGPYRFVRHPIYTGILLMCLGTAIVVGRLQSWLGFLLLCLGFWIKLKQEDSLLTRHFPNDYPAYRDRVKALVPFII
jgi:protein-S-isoprenylcysteine O-methyltransferase Ste14